MGNNESLYLALGSVLLGALAWTVSKIFDRAAQDTSSNKEEISELRHETRNRAQEHTLQLQDIDHRLRNLEKAKATRQSQEEN